ncbi:MAG: restriction endonuclease subunit S, partial [Peptostreptococcaceae bacterium]|nr:restriction endonuclease subunit S [Peptostreptococcaceae bacterium]
MKFEWKRKRLDYFAEVKGGKRLPKGKNLTTDPKEHPYIRIRDIGTSKILELNANYEYVDSETQKLISRYTVSEDDILISIVGTIGLIGIVGKSLNNANLTENCVKITNLTGIDKDYLYYYLISTWGQYEISKATVGAVQLKLPIKNIQAIEIVYPEEREIQRKIVSILSLLDQKIQLNNDINNN